jgi:DNA mismatch repair protein MutS
MAGVPQSITKRADEILLRLEKEHGSDMSGVENDKVKSSGNPYQLSFIQLDDPLLENIRDEILQTDVDTLTPIEALMKLNNIKKMISGDKN